MSALEPLHVVYLLVVVYALCYQLQSPLEPFLVESLSAKDADGAAAYASLQSFFAVVQMVGSFMVGYLLDVLGIRVMFALNFIGCALSYGLLAHATTMEELYLSKVPAVLMAGVFIYNICCPSLVHRHNYLTQPASCCRSRQG